MKLADREFTKEMKTISLVKLYELGKISSSRAAEILKLDRVDFLDLIGQYKVSVFGFQDENELDDDIANA